MSFVKNPCQIYVGDMTIFLCDQRKWGSWLGFEEPADLSTEVKGVRSYLYAREFALWSTKVIWKNPYLLYSMCEGNLQRRINRPLTIYTRERFRHQLDLIMLDRPDIEDVP